jgi:transposase
VLLGQGKNMKEACQALEISEQIYYRWCKEYKELNMTQTKKLKGMEKDLVLANPEVSSTSVYIIWTAES